MRWPLVVLAVPAALLGFVGLPSGWLPAWLAPVNETGPLLHPGADVAQTELHVGLVTSALSVALVLVGAGAALGSPGGGLPAATRRSRCAAGAALVHAFCVDDVYDRVLVRPVRVAARSVRWTDDSVVVAGGAGHGRGRPRCSRPSSRRSQPATSDVPHRPARRRSAHRRRRGGRHMSSAGVLPLLLAVPLAGAVALLLLPPQAR